MKFVGLNNKNRNNGDTMIIALDLGKKTGVYIEGDTFAHTVALGDFPDCFGNLYKSLTALIALDLLMEFVL